MKRGQFILLTAAVIAIIILIIAIYWDDIAGNVLQDNNPPDDPNANKVNTTSEPGQTNSAPPPKTPTVHGGDLLTATGKINIRTSPSDANSDNISYQGAQGQQLGYYLATYDASAGSKSKGQWFQFKGMYADDTKPLYVYASLVTVSPAPAGAPTTSSSGSSNWLNPFYWMMS